jgi:hypothetical protein
MHFLVGDGYGTSGDVITVDSREFHLPLKMHFIVGDSPMLVAVAYRTSFFPVFFSRCLFLHYFFKLFVVFYAMKIFCAATPHYDKAS